MKTIPDFTGSHYTVLLYEGTRAHGHWGMQAVTQMQVMGLMLNRCDSMLGRWCGLMLVENTTIERAGARDAPGQKKPFLASHDDSAETLALNSISEQTRLMCASLI